MAHFQEWEVDFVRDATAKSVLLGTSRFATLAKNELERTTIDMRVRSLYACVLRTLQEDFIIDLFDWC